MQKNLQYYCLQFSDARVFGAVNVKFPLHFALAFPNANALTNVQSTRISNLIKIQLETERNEVLLAEADKEFIDFMFHITTGRSELSFLF